VYDSPERLIAAAAEAEEMFSSTALAQGYSQMLRCRESSGQPLLAGWRLQRAGGRELQQWLTGNTPTINLGDAEPIAPLVASVILSLLETQPLLLDAYSDLELQAELLGSEPDLHYRQRLGQAIAQADPLPQLLKALQNRDGELQDAREEAELTLLQLHQTQADLQSLQQELQPKVANMEQQLQSRDGELQDAREEAELTLLQLHQTQEELEHYFLHARACSQLVEAQTDQLKRAKRLLAKLPINALSSHGDVAAVAVEVLPAAHQQGQPTSLQVQALLGTYASSLDRASALLAKAMQN
jgi:hypothetical protein